MDLSVIIVNWNTQDLLEKCLTTVYQHPPASEFDVWLVDNASTDRSVEMVREKFPQVRLIANTTNVGFAPGNNQAIRESSGEYVVLLNPDTEVKAGALDILLRFMQQHPGAGGAGSRLVSPDGYLQNSCSPNLTLLRELWRLFYWDRIYAYGQYRMDRWDLSQPRQVDGLQGACLMLRRAALDQVGLFDEDYFMYTEELDLAYRLRRSGWLLYWVPESIVVHYGGQSTKQIPETMFMRLYQSKLHYMRKHHGDLSAKAYKAVLFAAAAARVGLSPFSNLLRPSQKQRNQTLAGHYGRLILALPKM